MKQENLVRTGNKRILNSKRSVIGALLVVLVVVLIFILLKPPEHSVAAYCKVLREEKARIAKLPGDTHGSGVFNDAISDPGEYAKAFAHLEPVAPEEIKSDVTTLKKTYEKMAEDPTTAMAGSLSAIAPDDNLKKWAATNCK